MPFALNDSTRFISPTKTPEYLAAGRPVVSTPIVDVVRQYGDLEAVRLATTPAEFVAACEAALALSQVRARLAAPRSTPRCRLVLGRDLRADDHELSTRPPRRGDRRAEEPLPARRRRRRRAVARASAPSTPDRRRRLRRLGAGRAAGRSRASGCCLSTGGRTSAATPMTSQDAAGRADAPLRTAHLPHQLRRGRGLPVAVHRAGGPTSTGCWPTRRRPAVPMPINRTTLNRALPARACRDEAAAALLASRAEPVAKIRTSEDVVVAAVGRELYETFFRGYTRKQWGIDPSELDKSSPPGCRRAPTRRPLLHRQVPDHAGRRLHADVRAHARPAGDRRCARHRLRRGRDERGL